MHIYMYFVIVSVRRQFAGVVLQTEFHHCQDVAKSTRLKKRRH